MTTLAETVRRLGRLRWVELRLFEVLGGWVASTPEPGIKALLAAHSYHHAWHGRLWAERFPSGYGADLEQATSSGDTGLAGWVEELAALEGSVARVAGAYRVVLPRLIVAYRRWRDEADPVADGPLVRWLGFALADELDDWQAGAVALQELLVTSEAVQLATRIQGRLEASLIVGGWSFDGRTS